MLDVAQFYRCKQDETRSKIKSRHLKPNVKCILIVSADAKYMPLIDDNQCLYTDEKTPIKYFFG